MEEGRVGLRIFIKDIEKNMKKNFNSVAWSRENIYSKSRKFE